MNWCLIFKQHFKRFSWLSAGCWRNRVLIEQIHRKQAERLSASRFCISNEVPEEEHGRLMAHLREEQIVCRNYALRVIMVSAHRPSDKSPSPSPPPVPWLLTNTWQTEMSWRRKVSFSATKGRRHLMRFNLKSTVTWTARRLLAWTNASRLMNEQRSRTNWPISPSRAGHRPGATFAAERNRERS